MGRYVLPGGGTGSWRRRSGRSAIPTRSNVAAIVSYPATASALLYSTIYVGGKPETANLALYDLDFEF